VAITTYTDDVSPQTGSFAGGSQTNDLAPQLNGTVTGLNATDVLQVYEGTTLLGVATVSGGTWSYQLAATTDGSHTYHVVVTDNAGNQGTVSGDFSLIVDTQGPSASETISIDAISTDSGGGGDFYTNDNTLSFSGQLGVPLALGDTVQVSLDGGTTWSAATVSGTSWTFDHTAVVLPDASYDVRAQVVDSAGNVGQSTSQNVVVDTLAPSASISVSIIGISLDTGSDGSDYRTADNTLLFLGNLGLPLGLNEHVEISLDNGATWLTAANTGATEWQYDNTANTLADGSYNVLARVIDTAGNVGQSTSQVVVIDSTAPVGNSIEINAVSPDSGSPTDFITNTGALSFSGIITAPLEVGGAVEVSVDNGVTWSTATVTGLTWSFDNTAHPALTEGSHIVQARIVDGVGNVEQTAFETIVIDTVAPSASATVAISAISVDSGTLGDFITNDNTVTFNGTLGAALGSGEGVRVSLDSGATWSNATVTGTTWSYTHTPTLANATYTVQAQVFDTAGNLGQSASHLLTIDTVLPLASVAISGISTDTGIADFVTSDQQLIISTTLTGSLNAGEKVQISLDNGVSWHDAALVSGSTYAYDNTGNSLGEGSYTFVSQVIDEAGNRNLSATQAVTIDLTGPTVGYTVTLDSYTDDVFAQLGDFPGATSTNDTTPLLNGSVNGLTAGDTVRVYEGVTLLGLATISGNAWHYQLGVTSNGPHSYHAVITDSALNEGLSSSLFTLTVDTVAPSAGTTITITALDADSGINGDFNTNVNTLLFSGLLGAALTSDEHVEFSWDNGATYNLATVSGTTWSYDNRANAALADNNYTLRARVVDSAGNVGATTNKALVIDTAPPLATETISFTSIITDTGVSSSDFITSNATPTFNGGLGSALLAGESVQIRFNGGSWLNASNSGLTWSYVSALLADGTYTVDARVVDVAGNVGQSASQAVIIDTSAPSATITIGSISTDTGLSTDFKTSDTTLVFSGTLSAPLGAGEGVLFSTDGGLTYANATVTGTTWSYNNTASPLAEGTYNLKVRVSDTAGNSVNTANQVLTIDTTAPTATIAIGSISTDSGVTGPSSLTDFITNDSTLTFAGTLGSALTSDERVEISLDGGTSWLTATVVGTAWSYNNSANVMADGSYTVVARVIDTANNLGLSATQVVQIDTGAPTATAAISAISNDTGISLTDFITNDQTLTISATLTGTLNAAEKVQISLDNGSTWNNAALVSGSTYSFDNTATTLVAGSYNFRARVVDTAGNAGTVSAATTVIIDITPPAMTAVALTAITTDTAAGLVVGTGSTTDSALNTDLITRDPLLTVSGTFAGTVAAGEFLQISSDAGVTWASVTTFSNATHTWSYTDPVLSTGAKTYQLRAIDTAGNVATGTASQLVTVDTTAPLITGLVAPVLTSGFDSGVIGDKITTFTNITFSSATSGTAPGTEVGSTLVLVNDRDNDGQYSQGIDAILGMATVGAGGTWSVASGTLAAGSYHLGLMLVDAAGNRSAMTATNQIAVVAADVVVAASIGFINNNNFPAVKINHSGVWSNFVGSNSGNFGYSYYSQTDLSTMTLISNSSGYYGANVSSNGTLADFQRTGYQGLFTVGFDSGGTGGSMIAALTTLNDINYTKVNLTGNSRNTGSVVAYDKNGDGYLDFALGDTTPTSLVFVTNTAGVLTWMNGSTSAGGRPTGTGVVNNYTEVSAVDLNNNGTVDIVEHTNGSGNFALTTFINDQTSATSFSAMTHLAGVFSLVPAGISMTWADFNNDGFMDLYLDKGRNAANTADTNASRIYWNNQAGGFGTAAGTTGGTATYFSDTLNGSGSVALDWNHDGKMDVIEIPENGVSNNIIWYANLGSGAFGSGASLSTLVYNNYYYVTPSDFNWDGASDLLLANAVATNSNITLFNNNGVVDGTSLHLQIFDPQGLNVYYSNTVQLYNSAGTLVSSQIINPQSGMYSNDVSALVYFYGLSASETYTAVLLNSVGGTAADVGGLATLGGNTIERVNASWTGLTAGLATHNYVLSAEAGGNTASGNFIGTGYNDTFFATAGTDTYNGGGGWLTHYGAPAWNITGGEDIVDFKLAGSTAVTVNLNTATSQVTGFNTVTLTNIEGVIGAGGNDNLTAHTTVVNDFFDGRGGNDTYTITGGGHTLLTFTNINNSDATGGNGHDTAIGFGLGNITSVATADVIDLSAILQNYTGTANVYHDTTSNKDVLDKASEGLKNYLSVTFDGTHTQIAVDRDGTGGTFGSTVVLTLNNVSTDLETLLVNHQLIV
jgi:hypothetical protein